MSRPTDALVEAFTDLIGCSGPEQEGVEQEVREFIARHRLVSLGEPNVWDVEWETPGVDGSPWREEPTKGEATTVAAGGFYATTGRIRPVYTFYGDPIDVSEET